MCVVNVICMFGVCPCNNICGAGCMNLMQNHKDKFLAAFDGEDLHEQAQKTNPIKGNYYKISKNVSNNVYCICV
jgi:hypothetical protein